MATYRFSVRLTSDAEPGTGLGSETVNELVPRDHRGLPVINASHIKGLMRWELQQSVTQLGWASDLIGSVFGHEDRIEAKFHLTDAKVKEGQHVETRLVTRTALEETGVARGTSLRTTEVIPVGTVFEGQVVSEVAPGRVEDLAWRLALLSIPAIGGNRNRGCGACVVEIAGENRSPGELLQRLCEALESPSETEEVGTNGYRQPAEHRRTQKVSDEAVILRLVFHAMSPVCCPEIADKTNVISSGFTIPASAVQGAILHRLNRGNADLATATFESPLFRAWPLQPCWVRRSPDEKVPDHFPSSIRVSLTHRVAKLSLPSGYEAEHFQDEAIQPYDWRTVAGGAPLKASDGVLLRNGAGKVLLWRATEMPRVVTAHGVHGETDEQRNLFTVEAMAPMVWQGLVVMPANAAERLMASLASAPIVPLGKSRSVRGLGELRASRLEGLPAEWRTITERTVLVVQSPLLLATDPSARTAEEELRQLAEAWARRHALPADKIEGTWAKVNVLFGWNRHENGRIGASRVVMPGSVISFSVSVDEQALSAALRSGLCEGGRKRGYGAASVHPGKSVNLYTSDATIPTVRAAAHGELRDAVRLVLAMRRGTDRLPSPSQIRAVQQRLAHGAKDEKACQQEVILYIKHQTERTSRIWFTWEPIYRQVTKLVKNYSRDVACRALEVLSDLAAEEK